MVAIAIAGRWGPPLQIQLELLGLDMKAIDRESTRPAVHTLLKGDRLRIEGEELLAWDSLQSVNVPARDTQRCLWDFLELARIPDGEAELFGRSVLTFADTWGVLAYDYDTRPEEPGEQELAGWRERADSAQAILLTLIATDEGRICDVESMAPLRFWDEHPFEKPVDMEWAWYRRPDGSIRSLEEMRATREIWRLDNWRREQRAGRGLELQRELLSSSMAEWIGTLGLGAEWDEDGRRLEELAVGVHDIVGAHLAAIFASKVLGVFVCSICGKPYEVSEEQRRPRQGARRLCSEACRKEAKRQDNLVSWHRNKSRWLEKRRGGRTNGPQS